MAFSITSSFDSDFYLSQNPDVAAAIEAGLIGSAEEHYNLFGFSEGRDPNPYFDTSFYLEQNPDVAAAGINPLNHFNQFGETEGRSPNAIFNPTYYLEQNPDVAASGISPFLHFINHGAGEGRSPNASVASQTSEGFDEAAYLAANPDIADAIANGTFSSGYEHWLLFGFDEERSGAQNAGGAPIDQPNNDGTPSDNPDDSPADPDAPGAGGGGGGGTPDITPPTITSSPTFEINENETDIGTITANEASTFSIVGGDDQALFQIDPNTGALSFASAADFENPQDAGSNNVYEVEVQAQDASGNTSTAAIAVTVEDASEVNGGTIQAAIDAANTGDTIYVAAGTYAENLVIDKAITIKALNGGDVNIAPASGVAVTFATGVDGDVTLDGLDLVGNGTSTRGIDVTPGANIGTLTFTNGEINGFTDRGIFSTDNADPTNLLAMGALVVSNSTLSDNGNGGGNTAHIKLFGFNGDATFENIGLIGETGGSAIGSRPDNAIELIGGLNAPNSANPAPANSPDIGTVTFSGVTVSGEYHKNPIGIFNFGELGGLSITGLDLSGAVSSWKLFNIDGVTETNIDGSSYGITFPNTTEVVAEFQGEKSANQGTVDSTITGTSSSDQLNGKEGNDILNGGDGNDILIGGDGDDQLDGGEGIDTAIFVGGSENFTLTRQPDGSVVVVDNVGTEGTDTVVNVEDFVFVGTTTEIWQTRDTSGFVSRFSQGFETDAAGILDTDDVAGFGNIVTAPSGQNGIVSASGSAHAIVTQAGTPGNETGPFTRFDGYRDTFEDGFKTTVDIYLDTNWAAGEGFDYSVAANGSDGAHQRDFIFHVTKDTSTGDLLVGASNNTNFDPREDLETINHAVIDTSGWYTLEHLFFEGEDGTLNVAMSIFDADGNWLFNEVRNSALDTIPAEVGGNRYGWFTNVDITGGIAVDNVELIGFTA